MASPLIILMANAIFFGALSAMMIMIAVSVDAWQSYTFDKSVLKSLNDSLESYTILQLSNTTPIFKVLVQTDPQSNATVDYYLHTSYTGLWRLCDDLTGRSLDVYKNHRTLYLILLTIVVFVYEGQIYL